MRLFKVYSSDTKSYGNNGFIVRDINIVEDDGTKIKVKWTNVYAHFMPGSNSYGNEEVVENCYDRTTGYIVVPKKSFNKGKFNINSKETYIKFGREYNSLFEFAEIGMTMPINELVLVSKYFKESK